MSGMAINRINPGRALFFAIIGAVVVFGSCTVSRNFVTVEADEIHIKQNAFDGQLQVWTEPGFKNLWFGKTTEYKKSSQFSFLAPKLGDPGGTPDRSIKVRFNDGGGAHISGSLRWELPAAPDKLANLHMKFGSPEAIERQLILPVVERAVFMSGPLMSSKESSAARQSDLIQYVEDQVAHGVYKTTTRNAKEVDALSGQERTITVVELVKDESGAFARQEKSPLEEFGIRTYSFNINAIIYDREVEAQIQEQQKLTMEVQKSIANAKKAEQDAITAQKQGEADAAKARAEQEVKKAAAVTAAEQERDVAKLKVEQAELFKREQTLLGEGEAARRKAAILADGALEKKLATLLEIHRVWAEASSKQRQVPDIVFGNAGTTGSNLTMDLIAAKAARELAVDLNLSSSSSRSSTGRQVATKE